MSWKERLEREFQAKFGSNLEHMKSEKEIEWAFGLGLACGAEVAKIFDLTHDTCSGREIAKELEDARKEVL